jgi:FkbH-like protein
LEGKVLKVVVWDLDGTLWEGVLAEGDEARLRPGVEAALRTLDERGILQSIASRNDHDHAFARLRELGIDEYFLYPQIHWGSKVESLRRIAAAINVGLDSLCLVDDQPFERAEVEHGLPEVATFDAADLAALCERPELQPRFVTADSALRRQLYRTDMARRQAEEAFAGPQEEFLATLGMRFAVAPAGELDLARAHELTERTHQLNTTGYTYSYDELDAFRRSDRHLLLVAELEDVFGSYGKIGLALVEQEPDRWTIKLLLMSCRVIARGVGTVLLSHVLQLAAAAGVTLQAEMRPNDRNRPMQVTYRFAGFRETARRGDLVLLTHDLNRIPPFPAYVEVRVGGRPGSSCDAA